MLLEVVKPFPLRLPDVPRGVELARQAPPSEAHGEPIGFAFLPARSSKQEQALHGATGCT